MKNNMVAIVGRPNVGKSTFFNRLLQRREAIVDSVSGVTRDRQYGKSDWNGVEFSVIDTGGYVIGSDDVFEEEIRKQVILAIEEATSIIFVVDVNDGITDMDQEVANLLRRTEKPVFLMVNKVDSGQKQDLAVEFYALGLGDYYCVSGMSGAGTGELLDDVIESFPETEFVDEFEGLPRLTVIGRPNAGKSTFINALLGEERNIVTDVAGTTRDSLETRYNQFGFDFVMVDTAGMRKKSKVNEDLEFYSVMRSVRAIEHSDVCVMLVDATRGFEGQDLSIFSLAEKNRKGIVILVNKWDLIEKDTHTMKKFEEEIRHKLAPFNDVPIIFVSALTKQRVFKAVEAAIEVFKNRTRRIKTSEFNEVMLPIIERRPPPAIKGKYIKIKYCTQLPTHAPQFAFFANLPQYVKEPYKRYIENQIRKNWNFTGVPIHIWFRRK
ncbi:GTPase Der [Flavobacteriaceae bacterium UJ101]|nr:GTPase Der [Flavobacteriaceae bacterium UJ101]